MKNLAFSILLACCVSGLAFGQDQSRTYKCTTKDVVEVLGGGTLGRGEGTEVWQKLFDGIIIDTLTGALTYSGGRREIWNVVEDGNNTGNDYVLVPRYLFDRSAKELAAGAANDFIRVRTWTEDRRAKFIALVSGIALVAGTCEIAR